MSGATPHGDKGAWRRGVVHFIGADEQSVTGMVQIDGPWLHIRDCRDLCDEPMTWTEVTHPLGQISAVVWGVHGE